MGNVSISSFGKFKWLTQGKIDRLDVNTIRKDNPEGCT